MAEKKPAASPPPPPGEDRDGDGIDSPEDALECLLCSEPIVCFGVFNCGHFTCDTCALRMRTFSGANANVHLAAGNASAASARGQPARAASSAAPVPSLCPVCRGQVAELVITSQPPDNQDGYTVDEVKSISDRALAGGSTHARLDGDAAKARVSLLSGFFCPLEQCWDVDPATGAAAQDAFMSFDLLKEHLKTDHKMRYCKLCLDHRPAFLSEQRAYTDAEMDQHHRGRCKKDPTAFVGHPPCLFCGQRFYEGEALLKHMQHAHFSCDVCNAHEFTFVFYKNHQTLEQHTRAAHFVCTHAACTRKDFRLITFRDELALHNHLVTEHGQTGKKLPMSALGFNFSGNTIPSGGPSPAATGRGSPQPAGGYPTSSSGGVATAASTHADRISFDFANGKVEDVFTTPVQRVRPDRGNPGESVTELRKRLNQALNMYLAPASFEVMKAYSRDFLEGRSKATEYFTQLQSLFTDETGLNAVFAPLVATLPDAQKREALTAAKTMLTSAEATRHRKNQEEADAKRRLEAMKEANRLARQQHQQQPQTNFSSARAGAVRAAAPKGAWAKTTAKVGNSGAAAPTPAPAAAKAAPAASIPLNVSGGAAARAPGPTPSGKATVWGIAAPPSQPAAPTFLDPEAFPSLSSGGANIKKGSAWAGAGGKPAPKSAWGSRR